MLRVLNTDKANRTSTLEVSENDIRNLIESVDHMVNRQREILLENLPSEDQVRQKFDDFKALKEDLRKILELLTR
jgi:hypothetical protein